MFHATAKGSLAVPLLPEEGGLLGGLPLVGQASGAEVSHRSCGTAASPMCFCRLPAAEEDLLSCMAHSSVSTASARAASSESSKSWGSQLSSEAARRKGKWVGLGWAGAGPSFSGAFSSPVWAFGRIQSKVRRVPMASSKPDPAPSCAGRPGLVRGTRLNMLLLAPLHWGRGLEVRRRLASAGNAFPRMPNNSLPHY